MAATYGRHTGKTGVCVATLGLGATNPDWPPTHSLAACPF